VKTLCFSRKFIAVVSREQLLLGTKPLSTPAMMVINPKPDPPVVNIRLKSGISRSVL
jgi:hypothetical protein